MSSLFADTHNVVAIPEKSDVAEGFKQIIDFLSGSYLHYPLTVNPHIYISCIKQFWNTASVKHSGDVTRLQALVDKKKIMISEVVICEILQLDDAEGIVCLPNEEIFAGLAQMGYEKPTSWNEFSTTMASAVICLSKEPSSPPQQPQSSPQASPQGAEFPTQLQQVLNVCFALTKHVENLENDNAAQKLLIIKLKARVKRMEKANMVKSSKLRRLRKVGASRRIESSDDIEDVFNQERMIDDMDKDKEIELEDDSEVQEVVEVVTTAKLITEVVTTVASQVSAASATISAAKPSIPAAAPTVVAAYTRRKKGVIIRDLEEELSSKTPAKTPKVKDKGKGILVETLKPMKRKDQIELDAEYAKKLHEEINRDHEEFNKDIDWDAAMDHNTAGYKMDFFKGITYAQIYLIFQARFDENMRFLFKSREEMEEEDQEIIKSINETLAQKATKRRKLCKEAQEAEDLRKCLEVVNDEDDDVFIEATLLTRKVPVVDYQIVLVDNKPRFKIIKCDETHQLYISFTTLLENFDREDLKNLWGIVKDRFSTSKLTNLFDEYLLLTLKTMFEKPDGQDAIWRNQKSVHGLALVKSWKLLTSCGVHIITLLTVQFFLLVEKRYLLLRYRLLRFTLEQLVNVTRLQVEEESEMSLELLRFTR
nr:hypothetical protein [Tanacetum cinerariifolium]